jgi:hypothetical protein
MALGIGAACIGALEPLQLPLEGVLAAILPLIGITGDIALDGAEAIAGPVIIATMLLPYLVDAASCRANPCGRRTATRFVKPRNGRATRLPSSRSTVHSGAAPLLLLAS